ncbi:hypothetical protein Tco_1020622 [Tanacetum coccineum]
MLMEDSDDDLKELIDDDIFEAGEDMDDPFPLLADEETQPPPLIEQPSTELQHIEQPSTNHQSPSPAKDHLESFKEVVASYDDLKWEAKDFHDTTFKVASNTDAYLRNFDQSLTKDKAQHVEGIIKILTNLKEVQDVVKEYPALNKKVLDAAEAYTKNSSNLTKLLTLVKNFDFLSFKSTSVGPKMTRIKTTQIAFQYDIASLNTGIADVKSSSHIASISPFVSESSLDKKETPSHFKGEQADMATEEHKEEKVTEEEPKEIDGKIVQILNDQLQAYLDKKEQIERAEKEVELSKPEIIKIATKVVYEAEVQIKEYVWTTNNKLKPKRITAIYPNTKPVAITIYKNNVPRNFNVHRNFKFGDFGISEWDELSVIIPKKKNRVVSKLMASLSNKYERLKKIPGERRLNLALPLPEQDPSLPKRKTKIMKLEPKTYIAGLHCHRELPERVKFVNNLVIEEPGHGLFFIDAFGDEAF